METNMASLIKLGALCTAVAALTLAACGGSDSVPPPAPVVPTQPPPAQRDTALGMVIGNDDSAASGTYSWKGIPYAKPPIGALRWKAPADMEPWTVARVTQKF